MLIAYNGHVGNPGDTPLGIWPAGEPREVPDPLGAILLATGNYNRVTSPSDASASTEAKKTK